jgi:predicted DNA-binding transcriptional regulator AlpA
VTAKTRARRASHKSRKKKQKRVRRNVRHEVIDAPLHPDYVYRVSDGPKYFGLKPAQMFDMIAKGKLPKPFALIDGGKARGWLGRQIIEYHRSRVPAAQEA